MQRRGKGARKKGEEDVHAEHRANSSFASPVSADSSRTLDAEGSKSADRTPNRKVHLLQQQMEQTK